MNAVRPTPAGARVPLFARLGAWVARHRWPVLVTYVVLMVVVGVFGVRVFGAMSTGGFADPGSDSAQAARALAEDFGAVDPLLVLAVETPTSPQVDAAAAETLLAEVASLGGVEQVVSYWSTGGADALLGTDGRTARALVFAVEGVDPSSLSADIVDGFTGEQGTLTVYAFGTEVVGNAFTEQISRDLALAEAIAIPLTVILLVFVFGSVVAAGLPFLVAGGTILGSFLILYVITRFTEVSVFSLNLVTGLGLALGIDYALLVISRFRE